MSNEGIEKYLDEKFNNVFMRFDGIDNKMKELESDIKKIEEQGNEMRERVVRLETKHDSLQTEVEEFKRNTKIDIEASFTKIRNCKKESDNSIKDKVDAANNKQNLKIISVAVSISLSLFGVIITILKALGAV